MYDYIRYQLEASEKLFNLMKADHQDRMKDLHYWAAINASLIKKLEDRDLEISTLRTILKYSPPPAQEHEDQNGILLAPTDFNNPLRRLALLESQLLDLAKENKRLRDENEKLCIDLGLKNG